MPKKKKNAPKVTVKAQGSCEVFASFAMPCPLCRVMIPAKTAHKCELK